MKMKCRCCEIVGTSLRGRSGASSLRAAFWRSNPAFCNSKSKTGLLRQKAARNDEAPLRPRNDVPTISRLRLKSMLIIFIFSFSSVCHANWYQDIINAIVQQAGVTNGILSSELSVQQDIKLNQRDMQRLLDQINSNTTSHSGYGTYRYQDYQSYGNGANDWNGVIRMANSGHGDGALGQMIASIHRNFPADIDAYNRGVSNTDSQRYFAMKSQTTLAARAASELDYNKIQQQIAYQRVLMEQIENTRDIKAAMDLANRIQVESNLINLEILRQSALLNQQQAVAEQAAVMNALSNAKFLAK